VLFQLLALNLHHPHHVLFILMIVNVKVNVYIMVNLSLMIINDNIHQQVKQQHQQQQENILISPIIVQNLRNKQLIIIMMNNNPGPKKNGNNGIVF
jgi:hypothetical protein